MSFVSRIYILFTMKLPASLSCSGAVITTVSPFVITGEVGSLLDTTGLLIARFSLLKKISFVLDSGVVGKDLDGPCGTGTLRRGSTSKPDSYIVSDIDDSRLAPV
jgi:hypothetical protein